MFKSFQRRFGHSGRSTEGVAVWTAKTDTIWNLKKGCLRGTGLAAVNGPSQFRVVFPVGSASVGVLKPLGGGGCLAKVGQERQVFESDTSSWTWAVSLSSVITLLHALVSVHGAPLLHLPRHDGLSCELRGVFLLCSL